MKNKKQIDLDNNLVIEIRAGKKVEDLTMVALDNGWTAKIVKSETKASKKLQDTDARVFADEVQANPNKTFINVTVAGDKFVVNYVETLEKDNPISVVEFGLNIIHKEVGNIFRRAFKNTQMKQLNAQLEKQKTDAETQIDIALNDSLSDLTIQ